MTCSVEGCGSPVKYKGLCSKHYKRQWRHGDPNKTLIRMHEGAVCEAVGCDRVASKNGLCAMHYTRNFRYGRTVNIKASAGMGRPHTTAGYVLLTRNGQRVYEHIWKAEKALGKPLPAKAVVHHLNEKPWDNRPENLVVCPDQAYHMLIHARMKALA